MPNTIDLNDEGILTVRAREALNQNDFKRLAKLADPWIESHHQLQGLVIKSEKFPGWKNLKSFIEHVKFVKSHHKQINKVAFAVNGTLPKVMSQLAARLLGNKVKRFNFEDGEAATKWIRQ